MAISVSSGSNVIENKENPIRLRFPVKQDDYADARIRLTQALQTSLDLTIILELFFEEIQNLVPLQGMLYQHQAKDCEALVGREYKHRINYRLTTAHDDLGALTFSRPKRFREQDMVAIESVLSALICPLRNALQYRDAVQSALRDPLTSVGNRVALENALEREIQLAERHDQPLSMLVADIDFFKRINDQYGHACGDDVLKEIAQSIKAVTRLTDLTFRYGGEEFVVLLNKTDTEGAEVIAERIRKFVEKVCVETHRELIKSTISVGVSTLREGESGSDLFKRADAALYQAKHQGRNRVVCDSGVAKN